MPLLFSYGTLRQEEVQLATFGRRLHGTPDELVGFEPTLATVTNPEFVLATGTASHANARFTGSPSSRVAGIAFAVTDEELAVADEYEQSANCFRVVAPLASGQEAWVYVEARSPPTLR